ncbi:MAG: UMP kinase [Promethearchaeota archaeon]
MQRTKILLKVGGSLLFGPEGPNESYLSELVRFLLETNAFGAVVVGGGLPARKFVNAARKLGVNEAACDVLGIYQARLNARLLISALLAAGGRPYPEPPRGVEELSLAVACEKLPVMGGFQPGQSTTSVAFESAEFLGLREVWILTDVEGIFDSDPKTNPDAKLQREVTSSGLRELIEAGSAAAGEYRIFDSVSLKVLERAGLRARVLPGADLERLKELTVNPATQLGTLVVSKED